MCNIYNSTIIYIYSCGSISDALVTHLFNYWPINWSSTLIKLIIDLNFITLDTINSYVSSRNHISSAYILYVRDRTTGKKKKIYLVCKSSYRRNFFIYQHWWILGWTNATSDSRWISAYKRWINLIHAISPYTCQTRCLHVLCFDKAAPILEHAIQVPNITRGADRALVAFSSYMQLGDTFSMLKVISLFLTHIQSSQKPAYVCKTCRGNNKCKIEEAEAQSWMLEQNT